MRFTVWILAGLLIFETDFCGGLFGVFIKKAYVFNELRRLVVNHLNDYWKGVD